MAEDSKTRTQSAASTTAAASASSTRSVGKFAVDWVWLAGVAKQRAEELCAGVPRPIAMAMQTLSIGASAWCTTCGQVANARSAALLSEFGKTLEQVAL